MFSVDSEVYTNKNVQLSLFHFNDTIRYWIKAGVGCIEFDQDDFEALLELCYEYDKEVNSFWARLKRRFHGR